MRGMTMPPFSGSSAIEWFASCERENEMIDWRPFLAHWSRELMQSELAGQLAPPPGSPEWLGFEAATAEEVAELEHRLGLILPTSYKSFLFTSNGWRRTTPFISRIRPADEVDWFRVENEQWVEAYAALSITAR